MMNWQDWQDLFRSILEHFPREPALWYGDFILVSDDWM